MNTFLCSGRLGDFFHQLYSVKRICDITGEKAHIVIGDDGIHDKSFNSQCNFWKPLEEAVEDLKPLLLKQTYIEKVEAFSPNYHKLNEFDYKPAFIRNSDLLFKQNWTEIFSHKFNLELPIKNKAWIEVDGDPEFENKLIIHRTRKENTFGYSDRCTHLINWEALVKENDCVFVGFTDVEYNIFIKNFPGISNSLEFRKLEFPLQMAQAIKGGKYFIGNQTSPLALATAMQIPLLAELSFPDSPHYEKENNYYPYFSWVSNSSEIYYLNFTNQIKVKFNQTMGKHTTIEKPKIAGKLV